MFSVIHRGGGPVMWVPMIRLVIFWGSCGGPSIYGSYHLGRRILKLCGCTGFVSGFRIQIRFSIFFGYKVTYQSATAIKVYNRMSQEQSNPDPLTS